MAYELKQELRLTQKLLLTPQLRLAIKLLQLSRQELVEVVRQELEKNPVLEESGGMTDAEAPPRSEEEKHEVEWQEYIEESEDSKGPVLDFSERDEDGFFEKAASTGTSLKDYLLWQLNDAPLNDRERKIGEFLIGNIDEHGYLRIVEGGGVLDEEAVKDATVEEVVGLIGVDAGEVKKVLDVIHGFDPPGVCARTTRECLLIQARRLPQREPLVEEIIERHLEHLANRNYKAIAKEAGVPVEKVAEAAMIITRRLTPMPGSGFGTDEARVIVPDVFIEKVGGEYVVFLNDDGMPRLRISPYYRSMLSNNGGSDGSDAKGYIQERLRAAIWLIKSVHQRQRTLKRVAESIVKFQRDFLDRGLMYLKPLVLKDVAEDIGMHESTISRVTTNKYAQTPRGIFELKYFFSTGMSRADGSDITAEYIKNKIKDIIENEDPRHPLSDQQIVAKLKESGVVLARRTAAKYREELGFLSSSRRKRHY